MYVQTNATKVTFEDIKRYCDFSEAKFITKFTYGTLYRGKDGDKDIVVKVWDNDNDDFGDGFASIELMLLNSANYLGPPKPIKVCMAKDNPPNPPAVVYGLNPLDTVQNLIPKDTFSWVGRIKVALGFALTMESFHGNFPPCKIRCIDAAHILCDQNYAPMLYDFSMSTGGHIGETYRYDQLLGSYGYTDPYFSDKGVCSTKTDVFGYGVVLLGLITKIKFDAENRESEFLYVWGAREYEKRRLHSRKPSLVDQSLKAQPYFDARDGRKITNLAMKCIKYEPGERPTMNKIVKVLKNLKIVRSHGDENDINMVLEKYETRMKS